MTVWVLRELIKMRGYTDGDTDGGIWSSGQSQALIHDIPSCGARREHHATGGASAKEIWGLKI